MHWIRESAQDPDEARQVLDNAEAVFGTNVRRYRLQAGWTQKTLTEVLLHETGVKIDVSAVTRIEQGRSVSLRQALALSYALDAMGLDIMLDEVVTVTREELLEQLRQGVAEMQESLAGFQQRARITEQLIETRAEQIAQLEAEIESTRGAESAEAESA